MTRQQLLEEKTKVRLENIPRSKIGAGWELLPPQFVDLVERSLMLEKRIVSLDSELYGERIAADEQPDNPVDQQINLLSTAFGAVRQK